MAIFFNSDRLESLKKQILKTAGLPTATPANCKIVSLLIEQKIKVRISETTMKRIFGFAFTQYRPSYFTMDVLSQFCGFQSWKDFCEKQELHTGDQAFSGAPRQIASQITQNTLLSLQNKSGIPYYQTIKRNFIDDHFEVFFEEQHSATVIAAPAGHGKTIALCHWVEELIAHNAAQKNEDIILFFNANAFANAYFSNRDLNEWILSLLGYSKNNDLAELLNLHTNSKFILIIDGMDEYILKEHHFLLLLNQVLDILSIHQSNPAFKLILTMRNSTLVNYRHLLQYDTDGWFKGFINSESNLNNVPLFNINEIKQLCNKINPNTKHTITDKHIKLIEKPLYFQFYYKGNKENFSLDRIDHLSRYEFVSTFILNKIYIGTHSEKKVLLLNTLCENLDIENHGYTIKKTAVDIHLEQFKAAYLELLGIGYIQEINISSELRYNTVISFGNDDFLSFSLAKHMLSKYDNVFCKQLVSDINLHFNGSLLKPAILKWQLLFAVRDRQHISFELLDKVELDPKEKFDIIVFIGDLLKKEFKIPCNKDYIFSLFESKYNIGFACYFLGLEFIQPEYKTILETLPSYGVTNKELILIHCSLAITAIVELDINQLEQQLNALRLFVTDEYRSFPFNPLIFIEAIFNYLKFGLIKRETLSALNNFYANNLDNQLSVKDDYVSHVLNLLNTYTLIICKMKRQPRVKQNNEHRMTESKFITDESDLLVKISSAEVKLALHELEEGLSLYQEAYQMYDKNHYLPFISSSFYLIKLKAMILSHQNEHVLSDIDLILSICDEYGYKLIKLKCLSFILESRISLTLDAELYRNIRYQFIKITRECGLNPESFGNDCEQVLIA